MTTETDSTTAQSLPKPETGRGAGWLRRFVRRQRVRQADGSLYYTAHITLGRLRIGVGWAQNLPPVRGILRYVFCWRHPGNLYAPHYQCRILWAAIGFRILPPNIADEGRA